jgi:hypothetical protein
MHEEPSFRFVVLPDTQIYARAHPELFTAQTRWIADQHRTIACVLHVGDVTDDNSEPQWAVAKRAFAAIDGRVPYVIATGNHDLGPGGSGGDRSSGLHAAFAHAPFDGRFEEGRVDNAYRIVETPLGTWMAMALEFGPRPAVVAWANEVIAAHGVPTILATHAYIYDDGTRYDRARSDQKWAVDRYGISKQGAHDAEDLWRELVAKRSEIEMVVSGHVLGTGAARLTSRRADGTVAHQMLANYQTRRDGGDGYLRVITVFRDRFAVRTFSPHRKTFLDDPENEFLLGRNPQKVPTSVPPV